MGELPPPDVIFSIIVVLFFGIGLHEYAHCKFADLAGDPTPRFYGRVTLNLTKHFEPVGTMMMIITSLYGVGIGWGRPAPMNPDKMHNPRWDFFLAVIAGPMSNIVQAAVYAFFFRLFYAYSYPSLFSGHDPTMLATFLGLGVQVNVTLAVFNMIPLGPLDGHWLLGLLMPEKQRLLWFQWNRNFGRGALMLLIIGGQVLGKANPNFDIIGKFMFPIVERITGFFLGQH